MPRFKWFGGKDWEGDTRDDDDYPEKEHRNIHLPSLSDEDYELTDDERDIIETWACHGFRETLLAYRISRGRLGTILGAIKEKLGYAGMDQNEIYRTYKEEHRTPIPFRNALVVPQWYLDMQEDDDE
jgi:hypothetical protein